MRQRLDNPHREAHNRPMRVLDWIAPARTDPHDACLKAEAALGCKLWHRGDGEVHGYVNTSTRPDGSVYVCVHLYDEDCPAGCPICPPGISRKKAPVVGVAAQKKMLAAVGEHPSHKLTGDAGKDAEILRSLGYEDHHGAMPEAIRTAAIERAEALDDSSSLPHAGAPDGAEGPSQQDPGRV